MSDEKTTIYISPEEDLTGVRERLEKLSAHDITLVIPTETQLRSHVAWKLLRARVRELGKEVQIVSDSAQVRSMAKDVNFKVASSLEAAPTGKSRPPSRSGRILGNRSRPTGSMQRPATKKSTNLRSSDRSYQSEPANQWQPSTDRASEQPDADHAIFDDDLHSAAPSSASSFNNDFPMTPERGQHYDVHHIDTSPPIRPLSPHYLEEEPDLWPEDFRTAQDIREFASQGGASGPGTLEQDDTFQDDAFNRGEETAPAEDDFPADRFMTPPPYLGDDPIDFMDDALPPPPRRREQRGSVSALDTFETQEHTIHEVPDIPQDVLHGSIEDEGDQGDFVIHSDTPAAHQWQEPLAEDEQDRIGPSRAYNVRPRSSRVGRQSSPQPQFPPAMPGQGFDSDDDLPSLQDPPTQITPQGSPVRPAASGTLRSSRGLQSPQSTGKSGSLPPAPSRVSGAIAPQNIRASGGLQNQATRTSGNMPPNAAWAPDQPRQSSKQLRPGATPNSRTRGNTQLSPTERNRAPLSRPGRGTSPSRQVPSSRASVKRAARRRTPFALLGILAGIIILGTLLLLYWLLPTATVTIALPAQNYSVPVKLVADPASQTNGAAGTAQETTLKKDFTISGTGKATGITKVGTASARGTVFFTNNGNQQITIPSNILLTTGNGTQFITEDNIALGPKNSSLRRLPSFIHAQVAGDSGNVPAGNITVISPDGKNQIAQYNKVALADLNLQVTNDTATSGGGVGSAISVTQTDLANTQSALSSQLQNSVNIWLQQQLSSGDVAGKPVITPTLTGAPKANTIEQSGTFSAGLKQTVEVPVVRSAVLQAATIGQLNATLSQDKKLQNYQIVSDAQQAVQIPQFTPVSNGLSLTLNFKPTGKIIQKIAVDQVQKPIIIKSPADAQDTLKSLLHVQSVQVKISPGWLPFTPWQSGNIHVQFVAASAVPAKK